MAANNNDQGNNLHSVSLEDKKFLAEIRLQNAKKRGDKKSVSTIKKELNDIEAELNKNKEKQDLYQEKFLVFSAKLSELNKDVTNKGLEEKLSFLSNYLKKATHLFEKELYEFMNMRDMPTSDDIKHYQQVKKFFFQVMSLYRKEVVENEAMSPEIRKAKYKFREEKADEIFREEQDFLGGLRDSNLSILADLKSKLSSSGYEKDIRGLNLTPEKKTLEAIEAYSEGPVGPLKPGFGLKSYYMDLTKRPSAQRETLVDLPKSVGDDSLLNKQISLGDTHGNVIKLVNFLAAHGVIDFGADSEGEKDQLYQEWLDVYQVFESTPLTYKKQVANKAGELKVINLPKTDLSWHEKLRLSEAKDKFNTLLSKLKVTAEESTVVHLLGDELCDRGANDWMNYKVLAKLKSGLKANNGLLKILASDHGIDGVARFERDFDLEQSYLIEGGGSRFLYSHESNA